MTNKSNRSGGYRSLIVYWSAVEIYDLTLLFCKKYIDKKSRTFDQMIQATRSGKQNIIEASLEKSVERNLKLNGVARASYSELLEDYHDFLRQKNLSFWDKDDSRTLKIRKIKTSSYKSNKSNKSYESYRSYSTHPESFANLMITLCFKQGYLLDRMLKSLEEKFVREGGFRENLFKKRLSYKSNKSY